MQANFIFTTTKNAVKFSEHLPTVLVRDAIAHAREEHEMKKNAQERLIQARVEWNAVVVKYQSYGAADTEPRYHFECIEGAAINNEPTPDFSKMDANFWELYTASMKCGRAAKALTAAAKRVYNAILEAKEA